MAPREIRGALGGVFLLHGEEELEKHEAGRALVDRHLDPATRDFNLDTLSGLSFDPEQFASVVATPPMMAEWRVVVVREAEALSSSPKARELVLGLARNPPPGLAVVLLATPPSGTRAKFWTDLKSAAKSTAFHAIGVDDAPGWLVERARAVYDRDIELPAAIALVQAIGPQLGILSSELEKLVAVAGDGPVTVETVRAAGTVLPSQDRWAWFDLVGGRRFREALETLPLLLDQGESGVGLAMGIGTHLLRIGIVREDGADALRSMLPRQQQWLASRLSPQVRGWSAEGLTEAVRDLARIDRQLKSGGSDRELLEDWFLVRMAA